MNAIRLLVLSVCLLASFSVKAAELGIHWSIANSGLSTGSVGWNLERDGGWPAFITNHVRPAIEWCKQSGVTPILLIHHPFGQYTQEPMHLDGWDYAKAADAKWLTTKFSTTEGWKSVTDEVKVYAYVGGCDLTPRLRNLSPPDLRASILRNLQPIKDAGFRGVYVDYAENAITVDYQGVNAEQSNKRSVDTILLAIADKMFPEPAGIEAAPRAFAAFSPLWNRNLVAHDNQWQHRYGPIGRNSHHAVLGYDVKVLKGKVWRTLHYSDDAPATVAYAQAIAKDGHVPFVHSQPLIRAGVKASDLLKVGDN